jgi:hypothetical protein
VTQNIVIELLESGYGDKDTVRKALAVFRVDGLWPVDRHFFTGRDFAPSETLRDSEHLREEGAAENALTHLQSKILYNVAGYSDTNLPRLRVSATSN